MATTQNTFTGDGSNLGPFSFTFKWLESTDIKVTVAGVLKTAGTHYNLQSLNYATKTGGQVLFTAGNAPANGAAIVVYRETDDTDLAATFYSGSAIRAQDLNNNFIQGLYVTQESSNNAAAATTVANAATTTANTALSTANAASATATTASTNASAAVTTANTASTNASAAVSTANTASSNATTAVNTANSAAADAATALSTSNTALSTANTASSNASAAVSTANTASTNASAAVSTANTASSNASSAVSTANTASSNASTALSTANTAISTANAAASAVANAILYDLVANVAAIPGSPSNNDAVEVVDSTGIESFTPLAGKPVGFTGSSGLSVRIVYTTTGATWNWIQYFPNDPETRYFKVSGGSLNGQLRADDSNSVTSPVYAFDGDTDTGIAHTGANELVLVTGGSARLTIDGSGNVNVGGALTKGGNNVVTIGDTGTVTSAMLVDGTISDGDISGTAAISLSKLATGALPTTITVASANIIDGSIVNADISATAAISASKIQAASTSNAGVVQLTDSTSSTSTTTAGTPNAIKSAYDLANAAVPKSLVDAKGDLLVATANDTVSRLAVGSNNQVLTADSTTGTGLKWATPASGSWRFISSVTASNSASVAFTSGINSTYDIYVIAFSGVESTSGQTDLNLRFSTNGGSSYFSGASDYTVRLARNVTAIIAGTGQTAIKITDQVRVTTDNFPVSGFVYLLNASVSGKHTAALIYSAELDSPANNHGVGRSLNMGTGVVDAVQFSPSTGNMNGIFRLYGISNS